MRILLISILCVVPRLSAADCWTPFAGGGTEYPSPDAACQAATQAKYGHPNSYAQMVPGDPTQYWCYEIRSDGSLNYWTIIETSRQPEAYCSTPVCGPYSGIPDGPGQGIAGADFTNQAQIRAENINMWDVGHMVSDAAAKRVNNALQAWLGVREECTALVGYVTRTGCNAEVHHIIPAKDTNGCPCGSNSNKNAMLISRRVNGLLGNLPPNPAFLAAISAQYGSCP